MSCVKCGKKTEGSDVFCPACLEDMKRYPVKPGTKAHIPTRPELPERKPAKAKKEKTPEEQIAGLQKLVRLLMILVVTLAVALSVAVGVLVYQLTGNTDEESYQQPMSRNYTTSATTEEP